MFCPHTHLMSLLPSLSHSLYILLFFEQPKYSSASGPLLTALLQFPHSVSNMTVPSCLLTYHCIGEASFKVYIKFHFQPWLVCFNGLRAGLQTKRLLVQFPVRAHTWVAGKVPICRYARGNW